LAQGGGVDEVEVLGEKRGERREWRRVVHVV
jgi:hypothetical protein